MHNAAINGRSNPYGHTVRASSDPYANGYTHIATPQGMPTPEATEPWSAPMSVTMPSTVSSPASCGPAEDYRYMPTPVSAPLIDPSSLPPTSVPFQNQDVEYDSVDSGEQDPRLVPSSPSSSSAARARALLSSHAHGSSCESIELTKRAGTEHNFHRPSSNHHHHPSVSQSYSIHHQPQHWNYMPTGVYGQGYPNNPSM